MGACIRRAVPHGVAVAAPAGDQRRRGRPAHPPHQQRRTARDGRRRLALGAAHDRAGAQGRAAQRAWSCPARAAPRPRRELDSGIVDLVTTALALPDMDGLELATYIREQAPQAYIPIVVVSGSVNERLEDRGLGGTVTDYFDKSLGFSALAAVHPRLHPSGDARQRPRALRRGQPRGRAGHAPHAGEVRPDRARTSPASRTRSRCSMPRARRARRWPTSCSPTSISRAGSPARNCWRSCAASTASTAARCRCWS